MKYIKGSFVTVPNQEILAGMPSAAQSLFFWLCFFADENGECFPSRKILAKKMGIRDYHTIDKWVKFLLNSGIIRKESRFKNNEQLTNLYSIILIDSSVEKTGEVEWKNHATSNVENPHTELNPIITQSTKLSLSSEKLPFDTAWLLYDKKVGKAAAEKAWRKLLLEDQHAAIAYIPNYKKSTPEKQYRKNLATFINNRGWEDELIFKDEDVSGWSDASIMETYGPTGMRKYGR